jgi:hypothetical protein
MAAAQAKLEILPGRSVAIDGTDRVAGETVSVSVADAKVLIAEGYAVKGK